MREFLRLWVQISRGRLHDGTAFCRYREDDAVMDIGIDQMKIIFEFFFRFLLLSLFLISSLSFAGSRSTVGRFHFGVWLQDPVQNFTNGYNGQTVNAAEGFAALGITDWIGLWKWPSEAPPDRHAGYNLEAAEKLRQNGFRVIAGEDQRAIDWNNNNPQFRDTFTGYLVGDEPDMNKRSPWNPTGNVEDLPDNFMERARILRQGDPTRDVYANFGKPFAKIPAAYYVTGASMQEDFDKFTRYLTLASNDIYGMTDRYEFTPNGPGIGHVGMWVYGEAMKTLQIWRNRSTTNRNYPVWGFVETGCPFTNREGLYPQMPPEAIKPTVWNQVVNGANGVIFFVHDMVAGCNGHPLTSPASHAAVADTINSVNAFAAVLQSPPVGGVLVQETSAVDLAVRVHDFDGDKYIFAQPHGDQMNIHSLAVDATFTVAGAGTRLVGVMNENRTIDMVDGVFTDHFEPYQVHIYKIGDVAPIPNGSNTGASGEEFRFVACSNPKEQGTSPKICLEIPQGEIEIKILNARTGREVRSLLKETRDSGFLEIIWDGKDNSGQLAASGIYTVIASHNGSNLKRFKLPLVK